jgi:predicted O-methyltransferase YrrM
MVNSADVIAQRSVHARDFAESYVAEGDVCKVARALSAEVGVTAVSAGTGAALRLLAAAGGARSVIEVGTGAGVSALWLLAGMRTDGVLTTIDIEPEHQRMARRILLEAGHPAARTRLINGRALDVLPRLADRAYDLLFLDGDRADYAACVEAAPRLLRSGGMLAINGVLAGGRIADPTARDQQTVALREVVRSLKDSDDWCPALLPLGDGLLCAVRS